MYQGHKLYKKESVRESIDSLRRMQYSEIKMRDQEEMTRRMTE